MTSTLPLIIVLTVTVLCLIILLRVQKRCLQASHERERRLIENVETLVANLNKTEENLERQNDTVHRLLTEKRAAWGIPAID